MDCTIMWPVRYDMTRDECRKCLRCLELDAYGSMVSVLRAQGPFTSEKQKLLQELAKVLHISNERHRAEVRRAVNDEKLATIAEQLSGPNTGTDWTIEGRRVIPLLPRLKARSAFTTLANSLSLTTAAANERKPIPVKMEDLKDVDSESQAKSKLEEKLPVSNEFLPDEDKSCDGRMISGEIDDVDKNRNIDDQDTTQNIVEESIATEKRKSPSPLPTAPPNKVLVVSTSTLGALNHGAIEKETAENTVHLSQTINSLQHQSVATIPFNISCSGSILSDSKELVTQGNANNHTFVQANKYISTMTSVCTTNTTKNKSRTTVSQNKISTKITPAILLPSNISSTSTNSVQSDTQDVQAQENSNTKIPSVSHSVQKTLSSESAIANASCTKRVTSIIHSNAKPVTTKTVTSSNPHRVMAVCPGTTVSSGPGPPQAKQTTTLTCKKLPTTLNHQATAKMGVTLNSNKTVNISHHPNAKLASKTNVIVIQKGHTKGVTLSHAGKEVLGKVIMGGKNLCVTSQHNATSISVLPHHIALNNGDQAVTMLSATNSSHAESVKSNIKSGNTIVFNLRQDVLEKNKVLSQLLESSSVLTSEPKTVIQNTNARSLKEQNSSDLNVNDKEAAVNTDTVITSIKDEKQHRKSKDVYTNANSYVINSIDPTKFLGTKEILINPSQLIHTQDVPLFKFLSIAVQCTLFCADDVINNIKIEDTICSSEIDMFETSLGSTDINFENFQYLVEGNENHVLEETRSPILTISQINELSDS